MRNRNLGRRDPGPYPLLPKCPECRHHEVRNPERPDLPSHHPWCSKAAPDVKARWARREELRALRTARRVGEEET